MAITESPLTFHLTNPGSNGVRDALSGLAAARPSQLTYHASTNTICRRDVQEFRHDHVTIVAAAGGGHEPMFAGYVGHNGISGAVSGNVFVAPTGAQMLAALRLCRSPKGIILVVGNYTGDILNAGLAITRAKTEGIHVRLLVVGDDVSVGRKKGVGVGRRGLCGHLVALKVEEIFETGQWIADRVGTIALALARCALPSALVTPLQALPADTVELGMGAHGEPGLVRLNPVPEPKALVKRMIKLLIDRSDEDRGFLDIEKGSSVVLMVNNLGSTSEDILMMFASLAIEELNEVGIEVERIIYGPMVTSLKMAGVGIAIGRLPDPGEAGSGITREKFLECWDSPTGTVAWSMFLESVR